METETMGRVIVTALIENLNDLFKSESDLLPADQVRRVEVTDALVDSGATSLMLPRSTIVALGLRLVRTERIRTANGMIDVPFFRGVRLTIQGREFITDVGQLGDDLPVIVGQLPLEAMDWVIDMKNHKLIGNPAHGGEQMMYVL